MVPISIFFPKNSYLVEGFNRKLLLFDAIGLIRYWASIDIDMKYLDFKAASTGPKQISLNHLSGIVQTLFGGITISSLVFFIELNWSNMHKLFNFIKLISFNKFNFNHN